MTAGEDEDDGDSGDVDSGAEYCSLSDGIVTPDSANGFDSSSADMVMAGSVCDRAEVGSEWWERNVVGCDSRRKLESQRRMIRKMPGMD